VNRITPSEKVLTFFANDGRMFFVVPMGDKSCIGTTDTRVEHPNTEVTEEDRCFVLDNINNLLSLNEPLTTKDIISERWGVRPLAVKAENRSEKADWLKLSRKHIVEIEHGFISIFGGKLTDCLNVGEEIISYVEQLGVNFSHRDRRWYGEASCREDFLFQAQRLKIVDSAAERWWRFYDIGAFEVLANFRQEVKSQELLIPEIDYYRCEAEFMRKHEYIVSLEDFLRRRTLLAMVLSKRELYNHQGVRTVCELLFPDSFTEEWNSYFTD